MAGQTVAELPPPVLEAFRRGEDAGVRAAYERFSGPVYAVALSVLGDRELAAEAVQETFVRAWRASARYDPSRALGPWLFTIARRVAVDLWRAGRRTTGTPPEEDSVVVLPAELDVVWEAYQVRSAVERLPADERAVVRLQHFDQLTHTEIATHLGLPVGTVKSRSHRAHRRLAAWLEPLCRTSAEPDPPSGAYPRYADPGARHDD